VAARRKPADGAEERREFRVAEEQSYQKKERPVGEKRGEKTQTKAEGKGERGYARWGRVRAGRIVSIHGGKLKFEKGEEKFREKREG